MRKKKLFVICLAIMIAPCTLFVLRAHAGLPGNRQIQAQTCTDKDGNPVGVGNNCIDGTGHCQENPCGS